MSYLVLLEHMSSSKTVSYSASKGVNSSVGLCFFVATYRNGLISAGGHKEKPRTIFSGPFHFFCSRSALTAKMTYGNLFIFVFLWSHSGWPNRSRCDQTEP